MKTEFTEVPGVDEDVLVGDGDEGAEDFEDVFEDESDAGGADDSEDADEGGESTQEDGKPSAKGQKEPLFDDKQQKAVDRIVQTRLERQEEKLFRDINTYAGVQMDRQEVSDAARLWGILKTNPNLSAHIEQIISNYAQQFPDSIPQAGRTSGDNAELKAAVLDMRASDPAFNKYHKEVLSWAEDEGYDVTDERTLKLVYKAWRLEKAQSRQPQTKPQGGQKPGKQGVPVSRKTSGNGMTKNLSGKDVKQMADRDILASKGLSLFTEE